MHVDDRLSTVLQHRAAGERAARVQYRQLLDLLGEPDAEPDPGLARAAFRRLEALGVLVPVTQRERIAAECSARIRNPRLLTWLAGSEPRIAVAALSRAELTEPQWTALIPELPIRARGLLRHRRNMPARAEALLDRLGAYDRALPEPLVAEESLPAVDAADTTPDPAQPAALDLASYPTEEYLIDDGASAASESGDPPSGTDLGALVKRIEAFQRAREHRKQTPAADSPRLPLADEDAEDEDDSAPAVSVLFTTDETGRITWAEPALAPLLVGTALAMAGDERVAGFAKAFARRRPVSDIAIELGGAEPVAGVWLAEGAPRFSRRAGQFTGYVGRLRRPTPAAADNRASRAADRVRQLLHELRTPVTAIQGFAEVIQQQTVGPVPHEYRAIAAAIAGDAARMLAGLGEVERLARLEAGTQEMAEGSSDFVAVVRRQASQLQSALSPRVARLDATWRLLEAKVPLASETAETLAWRFLGTVAAATAAGERITLELDGAMDRVSLAVRLPLALAQTDDIFAADVRPAVGALGTGLFGAGFAMRLARAEARAAGGDLTRPDHATMVLTLPLGERTFAGPSVPGRTAQRADS